MRVTFIVEQYLDEGSRYYKRAFELLGASGYVPSVVNLNRSEAFRADVGPLAARFDELGLPGGYHRGVARLGRLLREHAAQVLHGMETIPTFFTGVSKTWARLDAPLIYHRHHGPTPSGRLRLMDRFAFRTAARVVAVSEHQAELVRAEHPRRADKVRVIYNGIGLGKAVGAGRDSGIARSLEELGPGPRLLLLGRLRPEKGHVIALDALKILLEKEPRAKMLFAGEGPFRDTIEAAIEERGLRDVVVLLGAVADVGDVLSVSDVLIVPSLAESFGLTAVEGFAAEVPVVAAAVGGLRETVVDGRSGLLVPPEDPGALAAAVGRLLRDEGLSRELVHAAKQSYLENFTPEAMVSGFMSLYDELTDRS